MHHPSLPTTQVLETVTKLQSSSNVLLSKYCHELEALAPNGGAMKAALPVDASCEDLEVDSMLGFLGDYVHQGRVIRKQNLSRDNRKEEER